MRFDLPIPSRNPGQILDRSREGVYRWRNANAVYRHFERQQFETWVVATTTRTAPRSGSPKGARRNDSEGAFSFEDHSADLLNRGLASPCGFAQLHPMDTRGIHTYLGIEAEFRRMRDVEYVRGEWRGVGAGSREYQRLVEKFRQGKASGVRSLNEMMEMQNSQLERAALEKAYRTASMRGDFTFDDSVLTIQWRSVRRMALAMGGLSETQYGLMVPGLPTCRVAGDLSGWAKDGKLERIDYADGRLPSRYVVARPEAETAISEGDLTLQEYDATAALRLNQREHDEAVGDGMMLLGAAAQELGLTVDYVVPESRMVDRTRTGIVPDFVMGINDGYGIQELGVEVVGKGGAYREAGFVQEQKKAGHLLYYPPFLGGENRIGRFV